MDRRACCYFTSHSAIGSAGNILMVGEPLHSLPPTRQSMRCNKNGLRRCLYNHSAYFLLVTHGDVGAEGNVTGRERKSTFTATNIAKGKTESGAVYDIVSAR